MKILTILMAISIYFLIPVLSLVLVRQEQDRKLQFAAEAMSSIIYEYISSNISSIKSALESASDLNSIFKNFQNIKSIKVGEILVGENIELSNQSYPISYVFSNDEPVIVVQDDNIKIAFHSDFFKRLVLASYLYGFESFLSSGDKVLIHREKLPGSPERELKRSFRVRIPKSDIYVVTSQDKRTLLTPYWILIFSVIGSVVLALIIIKG